MSKTLDIEAIRQKAEKRREREIAQAERRYREVIEHIGGLVELLEEKMEEKESINDSVVAILNQGRPTPEHSQNEPPDKVRKKYKKWPGFRRAIWEAASESPKRFSANDIIKYFEDHFPAYKVKSQHNISSELWRLRKLNLIDLIERGLSRKPNYYAMKKEMIENKKEDSTGKVGMAA